jgi:SAM-dependent methyltransferase
MPTLIERTAAAHPAAFTGERLTNAVTGQLEAEHYHRYLLALGFCAGQDVLDVATGEGYGAAMLARQARSVVACDLAADVIARAGQNFRQPNLRFVAGDARALPMPDASVDVVTCFEALEHFAEQELFLDEVRRVVRPGGVLLVSTPDREIYSPPGAAPNPYHLRELTRQEFLDLLGGRFAHVALARQRAVAASVLLPEASGGPHLVFERGDSRHFVSDTELPRAPYLVACASDVAWPPLPASLLILHGDLDGPMREQAALQAARIQAESVMHRLQAIESSTLWRATAPLRWVGLGCKALLAQVRPARAARSA